MSKAIRVRYENGVLKPLEPVELDEGEEVQVRIERNLRERLKDLIGILGRSSEEELERYLEEYAPHERKMTKKLLWEVYSIATCFNPSKLYIIVWV